MDNMLKRKYRLWAIGNIVIGLLFGILMVVFGLFSTGGGHNYILNQLFTAPVGFLCSPLGFMLPISESIIMASLLLVPIWWASMFFVAIWPMEKTRSRLLVRVGECLHFCAAILGLISVDGSNWIDILDMRNLPYILVAYSIPLAIYAYGHYYIFWLLKRKDADTNKKSAISSKRRK